MRIALLSLYDLGRQPFGLASPAAWLRDAGHEVACLDLAVEPLQLQAFAGVDAIGVYLPMHTATKLALPVIEKIQAAHPGRRWFAFGGYAPLNQEVLQRSGITTVLGGESEQDIVHFANGQRTGSRTSWDRLAFQVPDRTGLPVLRRYARLRVADEHRIVGYTETSRGCKHLCRHCPVVPVYQGRFRVVPVDVVLADIRQQVAAGAQHITFGDPDFWNGPTHARRVVEALHEEFPHVTYDATIKIEHLLQHRDLLPVLQRTGCLFVTSAVESLQDEVLARLAKGHTRADFYTAVALCREAGLALSPTFITFTPWTTRASYRDLLETLWRLGLEESVAPVQWALRLLIPNGSRLLELPEIQQLAPEYDAAALLYRWRHPDPAIDELAAQAMRSVGKGQQQGRARRETFTQLARLVEWEVPLPDERGLLPRATVPYLDEPWYC